MVAKEFDTHFDLVWSVTSFRDLAEHLNELNLLKPFLEISALSRYELTNVMDRLLNYERTHQYHRAINLAQRIGQCGLDDSIPHWDRFKAKTVKGNCHRHLGELRRQSALLRRFVANSRIVVKHPVWMK